MRRLAERHFFAHVTMVQSQCYHFGIGAPPILVYFSGDWDVHWGYAILTHGHVKSNVFLVEAGHRPFQGF